MFLNETIKDLTENIIKMQVNSTLFWDNLNPEQLLFLQNLIRYKNESTTPIGYEAGSIFYALSFVEQLNRTIVELFTPQGCDLLVRVISNFRPEIVYKYNLLFVASILQCQSYFYNVDSQLPHEAFGILRNNILDPKELEIYLKRMNYLVEMNDLDRFIIDLSNLTNIVSDTQSQLLYLRQVSFGPDMLLSNYNKTSYYGLARGGIQGFVGYFTGNTTVDLQALNTSIEEDVSFHEELFNLVKDMDYDDAYNVVIQKVKNFDVYKSLVCYGHSEIEIKAFRSVGGAAFLFEAFYNCSRETTGYRSPSTGRIIKGYCTHYESGYMASDELVSALISDDVLIYENIYCPIFLGVTNPTKDKLLTADYHLFSVYIPGEGSALYTSPVQYPKLESSRMLRTQVFLTYDRNTSGVPVQYNLTSWAEIAPTIDGVISTGEWDDAVSLNITFSNRNDVLGKLYVKNDYLNIYFAIVVFQDDFNFNDWIEVNFDNDNDGICEEGDDRLVLGFANWGWDYFVDFYYISAHTSTPDTKDLGTSDGLGHFSHSNPVIGSIGEYVFELTHPLNSLDDKHDVSLSINDTVGVIFNFVDNGYSKYWPAKYYGNTWPIRAYILIATPK